MSSRFKRQQQQQIERNATTPPPPSLERAFEEIEALDNRHPETRGQPFGSIIRPAGSILPKRK